MLEQGRGGSRGRGKGGRATSCDYQSSNTIPPPRAASGVLQLAARLPWASVLDRKMVRASVSLGRGCGPGPATAITSGKESSSTGRSDQVMKKGEVCALLSRSVQYDQSRKEKGECVRSSGPHRWRHMSLCKGDLAPIPALRDAMPRLLESSETLSFRSKGEMSLAAQT